MNIGVPTEFINGIQENSRCLQILAAKYDYDCCFIPDSYACWIYYLFGQIKMGDEVLGLSGLGAIFIGHGADGDFYSDDSHE